MSIGRAAAREAVRASGRRWLRTRADALHLQRGRRLARVMDVDVMEGRAGEARVRARTLVLARDPGARGGPPPAGTPDPARTLLDGAGQDRADLDGGPGTPDPPERGVLGDGTLWWWADADPALPGLAATADPDALAALLGTAPGRVRLTWRGYRPRERAVIALDAADTSPGEALAYLKVLPPAVAERVAARQSEAWTAGVPVPPVLRPPARGVLTLGAVPGLPWRALLAGERAGALDPARVGELLDRLPPVVAGPEAAGRPGVARGAGEGSGASPAAGPAEQLEHAAWAAVVLDPEAQDAVAARTDRLRAALAAGDPGPVVPVHGDLHPGNLHVDAAGARVTGLVDGDGLGPGHRVDDWAVLVAHLEAAAVDLGPGGGAVRAVAERFRAHALTEVDELALAARVGVVLAALGAEPAAPRAVRVARRAAADAALARVSR